MEMACVLEERKTPGYERVVIGRNEKAGLTAVIAIHDTTLGPACGGVRLYPYPSLDDALKDVLRLAKGMSYKSSLAGIGFGGGKSVVVADPRSRTDVLFQAMGEFVDTLKGRYIAAKDVNVTNQDLLEIRKVTPHVLGIEGVPGSSGDPSPVTAQGVFRAMEATCEELTGSKSLRGVTVALQGLGYVGYDLAERIKEAGGNLIVNDIDATKTEKAAIALGAKVVGTEEILSVACDILSPCALGATLNSKSMPHLKCKAIVGCANNQLESPEDGDALFKKGILYAPDFAVNSGGIINIFIEFGGYSQKKALLKADEIYTTLKTIYRRAKEKGEPPFRVADRLAEERIRGGV